MSETVSYKGKLKQVFQGDESQIEEWCKDQLKSKDLGYCDTYKEMFQEENYMNFAFNSDKVYQVVERKEMDNDDIFEATQNGEEINFVVQYYNGGCSFSEAIDCALEKLNK